MKWVNDCSIDEDCDVEFPHIPDGISLGCHGDIEAVGSRQNAKKLCQSSGLHVIIILIVIDLGEPKL